MIAAANADMSPPVPPIIPAGFADSHGKIGFFAGEGGKIEAVNLEDGKTIWTSKFAAWPLFTRHGWLAAAFPDEVNTHSLRIGFLKPSDGNLISESAPLTFSGWSDFTSEAIADESGIGWGSRQGSFRLEAWAEQPQRPRPNPPKHQGHLQLRWKAQKMVVLGIRPPYPPEPAKTGRFWIDPSSGKIEKIGAKSTEPFGLAPPKLLAGWKPEKGFMYWSWTGYGSAWTDKPRPFWIMGGVQGFLCKEYAAPFRLQLHRWRPYEPLRPLDIAEGQECVPIVSLDGRHVVIAENKGGKDTYRLIDLYFVAKQGALTELPLFEEGVTWKFTVLGDLLLYVTENKKMAQDGGMDVKRHLVALDRKKGIIRWKHDLASRYEAPPVPGQR